MYFEILLEFFSTHCAPFFPQSQRKDAELLKLTLLKRFVFSLFQDEKYLEDADIDDLFKEFLNTVYLI